MRNVLTQTFYSLQDSMIPVIIGAKSVAVNITLNLILATFMGVAGLDLATIISTIIGTLGLYYQLSKKIEGIPLKPFLQSLVKITHASSVMGLVVHLSYKVVSLLRSHYMVPLVFSIIAGLMIYVFTMKFMKIPEYDDTVQIIKTRLSIKKLD